jgi:hypothetical protein
MYDISHATFVCRCKYNGKKSITVLCMPAICESLTVKYRAKKTASF